MEFCLFILAVLVTGALFLRVARFITKILSLPGKFSGKAGKRSWWKEVLPYALVLILSALYLPFSNHFWGSVGSRMDLWMSGGGKLNRLAEVFLVARFFRAVLPAAVVLIGLAAVVFASRKYPSTAGYRYLSRFDHRRAWVLVAVWVIYLTAERLYPQDGGQLVRALLLNLALVPAGMYFLAGFQALVFLLRKRRFPWAAAAGAVTLPVVVSGPVFFVPLVVITGVGVSDIWMRYAAGKKRKNG